MTRFPHDQFAKEYIKELLSPLGQVETSYDVVSEIRSIDVWFVPTRTFGEYVERLGWLGRLVTSPTAFEPFRNAINDSDVCSCMGKLHTTRTQLERQAKRERRRMTKNDLPQLWILTPTASTPLLVEFGFQAVDGDRAMQGVYQMPPRHRTGVVVVHQLPEIPETLWLRVLGRGTVQQRAIEELAALPQENKLKQSALQLLYDLQANLAASRRLSQEDRTLVMALAPLYQQRFEAVLQEGIERGIERGIEQGLERGIEQGLERGIEQGLERGIQRGQRLILENLLRVRFGEFDERMPILVESLSSLSSEQFTLFLLQLSQVENDEVGQQQLPCLAVEKLLQFRWGEAEEGEDREILVQTILALPIENLAEFLSQLLQLSREEVLARLRG
jgi:hypothetical protein